MNKRVYLGLAILEITKIVMNEFCHNYMKPKYGEKAKLCYIATGSLIVYIKTEDIYVDIVKDVCSKRQKQDLIFQVMNQTDHYLNEKMKMI